MLDLALVVGNCSAGYGKKLLADNIYDAVCLREIIILKLERRCDTVA